MGANLKIYCRSVRNYGAGWGLIVIAVSAFLLVGCGAAGRRTTYIEDLDGVKAKIESVQRELSADLRSPGARMLPAPAESAPVKTLSKTGEYLEFEAEGEGVSSKYERPLDAERRAEEAALAKGVRTAGVNVYTGFQNITQNSAGASYEYLGKYLSVWSNALVAYERAAPPDCALAGGLHRCTVKIKGKVYYTGAPDPEFGITAALGKPAYFEADNLTLSLAVQKDSYITVLHCDEEGAVTLIFPNRYYRSNFLAAGETLQIPGEGAFELKTLLPAGRAETAELLHVIATKRQPLLRYETLLEEKAGPYTRYSLGGLKDLALKMSRLDRADWTTQVLLYEVKKRPQ